MQHSRDLLAELDKATPPMPALLEGQTLTGEITEAELSDKAKAILNGSEGCPHQNTEAHVNIHRRDGFDGVTFEAELTCRCKGCGVRFVFEGGERRLNASMTPER
jgi:hypothetical protein